MDLWDMTKLLFRRWRISLPLLLTVLVLVGVASQTVKPDYSAKAHIQLIPPPVVTLPDGQQKPIKNPWFDLGYVALGNAAMIDVTRQSVLKQMVADGLSDNVTVTMDRVPLFEIETVGNSPEQATATAQRMLALISEAVAGRQASLQVAESDLITTLAIDDGTEVEVQNSKLMRVMVVALGAGLLFTAGVTVAVDAWLRRRARRRTETGTGSADAEAEAGARPATASPSAAPFDGEITQVVGKVPRVGPSPAVGASAPRVAPQPTEVPTSDRGGQQPWRDRPAGDQPARRTDPDPRRPASASADATVVLPVSHSTTWPRGGRADRS
ncbi:hypothetical protein QTQ03_02790 [Micromonospora sp. WMMA1363]|uniref:hypothetical protein n=1 Tax=Micromonospora sp. WMMA1363 TaxID=3053985 RepID=UPI00259CEC2E|nr:hypothetical protein [Micromonospora sp. WMMA1363]MDM4718575.1 hypothetical protein [Micromonospora sp. WMMA1363]